MKKFSLYKEELESQNTYECSIGALLYVEARSESEASSILTKALKGLSFPEDIYLNEFNIENITKQEQLLEKFAPSAAIINTQKMMQDYLSNNGATKVDSHYQNLEKMLKVFQSTTVNKLYTQIPVLESKNINSEIEESLASCDRMLSDWLKHGKKTDKQYKSIENIKRLLSKQLIKESNTTTLDNDIDINDVNVSIKEIETLMKNFIDNKGGKDSQQYENYENMLEMLKDIKNKISK